MEIEIIEGFPNYSHEKEVNGAVERLKGCGYTILDIDTHTQWDGNRLRYISVIKFEEDNS